MDLIASGEGGYNSYNRGTKKDENGKDIILPANQKVDFSSMTVAEIQRRQALKLSDPDRMLAVGRYQFITGTLKEAIGNLDIDTSRYFDPELQDQLFNEDVLPRKRRQIQEYVKGVPGASLHDAQKATCKEWASVEDPDSPGHVYARYEAQGNKMHTTAAQVALVLNEMRDHYRTKVEQGLSSVEAWVATTKMGPSAHEEVIRKLKAQHGHVSVSTTRGDDQSKQVAQLQECLRTLGYSGPEGQELVLDGHFGSHTRHALKDFQRDHRLVVDGIAGRKSLAALDEAMSHIEIGRADASYLQQFSGERSLAAYQALMPKPLVGLSVVAEQEVNELPTFPSVASSLANSGTIQELQRDLDSLGFTDHRGRPLPMTGEYDAVTRNAVMGFQEEQNMPVTGLLDPATLALVDARATIARLEEFQAVPPLRDVGPWSRESVMAAPLRDAPERYVEPVLDMPTVDKHQGIQRTFADPSHPQHELYNELKDALGEHVSDARLAQITSACHQGGIRAGGIDAIRITGYDMIVSGGLGGLGGYAEIDLSLSPTVDQSVQQAQSFDHQQARDLDLRSREQAQGMARSL